MATQAGPPLTHPSRHRGDPRNIHSHSSASLSTSSSSSDSLSVSPHSEVPSDWDVSSDDPSFSSTDSAPCPVDVSLTPSSSADDPGGFQGQMVENSIYEGGGTSFKAPKGPRPTRSYRLRHRPVPDIPKQITLPPQDWSAPPALVLTTSPEHHPCSLQGPPGGNDHIQKAPLQRRLTPIVPYGETFLYNHHDRILGRGPEEPPTKESQGNTKTKKLKKKQLQPKESAKGNGEAIKDRVPAAPSHAPVLPLDHGQDDDFYSTVEECAASLGIASRQGVAKTSDAAPEPLSRSSPAAAAAGGASQAVQGEAVRTEEEEEGELYSVPADALGTPAVAHAAVAPVSSDISPYACFYGAPKDQRVKAGWLDKLSPQGKRVFQRRWVRFDGERLSYYNNDKEMYSKGIILASAIRQVRGLGDNKFEVVTSLRTFIFRAEREGERQEWMEALQTASRLPTTATRCSHKPSSSNVSALASANKRGALELRGYKGRVLVSLQAGGSRVRLCKTEQDFNAGLAITEVELTAAHIKCVDRRGFEISTPFKNFCFTAESEREREEWMEAVQESIAETLSDYEVAEKIWFNEANRICADCRAPRPEWASVNLVVVVCKRCAENSFISDSSSRRQLPSSNSYHGQHRSLGPSISKVRSLKLDISVWSNELVELFLEVGNENANGFWAAALPPGEELHAGASAEQRATFLRRKYRERRYCRVPEAAFGHQEALNQALCSAVVTPDVLCSMALAFSGADVMCATGDPEFSTPYMLAQRAGQRLQMEFLHHNKLSDFPKLEPENSSLSEARPFMDGFLYISPGLSKATLERRGRDEMVRRWCTLEGGFLSYYESERSPAASGRVDVSEVVSLAVSNTETMTGAGAVFTLELYLLTERALLLGAQTQETQHDWLHALAKCFVPCKVEGTLLRRDGELIGRLHYKEGHDLYHWRVGWFALGGSSLLFSSGDGERGEGSEGELRLKQLQELTVSTHTEGEDKIQVLLMVEGGRTVYIHGFNRLDFALWHSAIALASGTDGRALGNQQLNKNGVPIVVDSCMAFVTQYGLCQEGVYESPGDPGRVALLLAEFARDARNVKLRAKEHRLEDITHTLTGFLAQAEDALLTKELYPYWLSALDEKDERQRVKKYSAFIQSLPRINRSTLEALLQHLYRIQQCSHLNQMWSGRLASSFSSCLFQTRGQTPLEVAVVHDLIANYVPLFAVNEDQVQQMERENSFIVRWNDKKDTTFSPAGDLIFEVYLEKRQPENCCLIKLSPSMRSSELAECALSIRNIAIHADNSWTTFEVIENGELERPLHHQENILEQVLEWSSLDDPGSAFLVIKTFQRTKMVSGDKDQMQFMKGDHLKFKDGSSKLLSGHKFQDKYVVLRADKLLLYRDYKSTKAEKEVPLNTVKCYLGLRKKLKPPNSWGFTVYTDKHQWHFCCEGKEAQLSWVTDIIRMKYGSDLWLESSDSGEAGAHGASRRASVSVGQGGPQSHKHNAFKQPTDRTVSLGVAKPKTDKDAGIDDRHKTDCSGEQSDRPSGAKEAARRHASVGVCLPQRCPSPSTRPPTTLALPGRARRATSKSPNRTSAAFGEMPPNVLNELKSVLSRAGGQSAKDDI